MLLEAWQLLICLSLLLRSWLQQLCAHKMIPLCMLIAGQESIAMNNQVQSAISFPIPPKIHSFGVSVERPKLSLSTIQSWLHRLSSVYPHHVWWHNVTINHLFSHGIWLGSADVCEVSPHCSRPKKKKMLHHSILVSSWHKKTWTRPRSDRYGQGGAKDFAHTVLRLLHVKRGTYGIV